METVKIVKKKNGKYVVKVLVPESKFLFFFTVPAYWSGILFSVWTNKEVLFKSYNRALNAITGYLKEAFKLEKLEEEITEPKPQPSEGECSNIDAGYGRNI